MHPTLTTAVLCKDERARYLERVLRRCLEFSDSVVVVDDNSTDGSGDLAADLGCQVFSRTSAGMWGNESPARAELWERGSASAGNGWLLIADADMILYGDPRPLTCTTLYTSWAWTLYDVWQSDLLYRADGYWQGHLHPRPWMYRPSALQEPPVWASRGIHTGHHPLNFPLIAGVAPEEDYYWLHMAYATPELRERKHQQYLGQAHQLTEFELAHANSILD